MLDRNKTAITHRITAVAAAYLDGLGCKPVETEVEVQPGWLADVASYWYPTATESKRLHLVQKAREIIGTTEQRLRDVMPRVYGDGPFTALVEVKVTKGDFAKDRKWLTFPPAHLCFVAFPAGLLTEDEIPKGWYGLEMSTEGRALRKVHRRGGLLHAQHMGLTLNFIAEVGIRRDHRTRYAAIKHWIKHYRIEDSERKKQYSAVRLLDALASWLQGTGWNAERPLSEVLPEIGIKKLPHYAKEAVAYFEDLRRRGVTEG